MRRTTLILDEELYRAVKRKAVDRGRPMRILVEEALRAYLALGRAPRSARRVPRFGVYAAAVKGPLTRKNIYGERISRKM